MVWDFSHVDCLPVSLIDQAVTSHLDILTQSQHVTDQIRNLYIEKCIHDIRDGRWAVPAIRHLQSNLESMLKQPYSKSHKVRLNKLLLAQFCRLNLGLCIFLVYMLSQCNQVSKFKDCGQTVFHNHFTISLRHSNVE